MQVKDLFQEEGLGYSELCTIRRQTNSRKNFIMKVVTELFNTHGLQALSPKRMDKLKRVAFAFWRLELGEDMEAAWRDCTVAIDKFNRTMQEARINSQKPLVCKIPLIRTGKST